MATDGEGLLKVEHTSVLDLLIQTQCQKLRGSCGHREGLRQEIEVQQHRSLLHSLRGILDFSNG
jgi:hypothetical protein